MPYAEVGNVKLFYTDEGAGDPPILFVHGYSCDSHDWSWQIPHFVGSHRVIAMDNRGHGRSGVPESGYDHDDFANDTANLLGGMALESVSAPHLARRKCPVLTMYTDPGRAALEATLMSDSRSRAVSFEGSGHWLHQERPAEFNYLVESWLAGLAAS